MNNKIKLLLQGGGILNKPLTPFGKTYTIGGTTYKENGQILSEQGLSGADPVGTAFVLAVALKKLLPFQSAGLISKLINYYKVNKPKNSGSILLQKKIPFSKVKQSKWADVIDFLNPFI